MLLVLLLAALLSGGGENDLGATVTNRSDGGAAALRLVAADPIVVRGVHFGARERVRVVARIGRETRSRLIRTSPAGAFTVHFESLSLDRCGNGLLVTATGTHRHARLRLPLPECAPA